MLMISRLELLVGMTGFEPATSSSRTTRATKLRHIPMLTCPHGKPEYRVKQLL